MTLSNHSLQELEAELSKRRAEAQEEDECMGQGECHGSLVWCARCGNVGWVCPDYGCDLHRHVGDCDDGADCDYSYCCEHMRPEATP